MTHGRTRALALQRSMIPRISAHRWRCRRPQDSHQQGAFRSRQRGSGGLPRRETWRPVSRGVLPRTKVPQEPSGRPRHPNRPNGAVGCVARAPPRSLLGGSIALAALRPPPARPFYGGVNNDLPPNGGTRQKRTPDRSLRRPISQHRAESPAADRRPTSVPQFPCDYLL
jgi:hypothetical protein